MELEGIISDSFDYSKNALLGNWRTWLVFIACGLPGALIGFLFDQEKMLAADYWIYFPWTQLIALLLAGFLLSFFTTGYLVRVCSGITPPPKFENWVSLYIDGIKVFIVQIIWLILIGIVFCIMGFFFFIASALNGTVFALPMWIVALIFMFIAIVLTILIFLCSIIAIVRYARTGSIREGVRYSAVIETIRAIGWGSFIIALIILMIIATIYFFVVSIFTMIPFIGWILSLALSPFILVFSARYLSRLYDLAEPPVPPVTEPAEGI